MFDNSSGKEIVVFSTRSNFKESSVEEKIFFHGRGEERGRNVNGTFSLKDNPKIISQSSVLRDCHSTKFFLETPTCDEQQSIVQGRGAMYFHFSTRSGGKFLPRLSSLPLPFQRNRWARGERREVNSPIFRPAVDREKREETER